MKITRASLIVEIDNEQLCAVVLDEINLADMVSLISSLTEDKKLKVIKLDNEFKFEKIRNN